MATDNKFNSPAETVKCSCGESTTLYWSDAAGKYIAANPSWVFSLADYWNCGEPGHRQAS